MNRVWTEEELEILRRDREAKVPVPVTAAKLGRPVPATYARARLIGTLVQPHQSWDEASVARLRELVCADPPMTDKRIAGELRRSVTQIRWKMQDLGLIGVRDLSKLAKITAAESARPKVAKASSAISPATKPPVRSKPSPRPVPGSSAKPVRDVAAASVVPQLLDPQAALEHAIKSLETVMAERLKNSIAETEAGMIKAARAAIAEKGRIDQRLVIRVKRVAEAESRRLAATRQAEAEAKKAAAEDQRQEVEARRTEARKAEAKRQAEEAARQAREQRARANVRTTASSPAEKPRPVEKKIVLSAVQGVSQNAAPRPAPQSAPPPVSKIVVMEAPAAARAVEDEHAAAQTSGRGGWKSVRRDPARVMAQAKAKAKPANRADAVDLAQAAQAAIERFIAERGVTRTESSGIQSVVSRLQARGYIVVRDETGWTIDQRHRIASEAELMSFAEARGITLSAAA
ncbi:FKBP-type peptidyl-prolyl cis-trans isomerase [Microvirga lupini]|uniref:FKBP-type peptidyl-prolyl cis-trans isomerase n=1 Tax=Microvirga lupini TaxID=420324 RepID=A0A7W4VRC4_9HYPH|nr:hypothetical protein [Microvirga lupini]MBB3021601.1 FKBP-type peptidyl-prolyl cis-trans isomerase [Microvirga lupini]